MSCCFFADTFRKHLQTRHVLSANEDALICKQNFAHLQMILSHFLQTLWPHPFSGRKKQCSWPCIENPWCSGKAEPPEPEAPARRSGSSPGSIPGPAEAGAPHVEVPQSERLADTITAWVSTAPAGRGPRASTDAVSSHGAGHATATASSRNLAHKEWEPSTTSCCRNTQTGAPN